MSLQAVLVWVKMPNDKAWYAKHKGVKSLLL